MRRRKGILRIQGARLGRSRMPARSKSPAPGRSPAGKATLKRNTTLAETVKGVPGKLRAVSRTGGVAKSPGARAKSPAPARGRSPAARKAASPSSSSSKSPPATNSKAQNARGKSPAASTAQRSTSSENAARRAALDEIEDLVLWKRPLSTLYHFGDVLKDLIASPMRAVMDPKNIAIVGPAACALFALFAARHVKGPHTASLERMEHQFWYTIWWFMLGVASSVGLGTGAHTGTLFLFPHICAVVRTAENNKKVDFDHSYDSWHFVPKLVRLRAFLRAPVHPRVAALRSSYLFFEGCFTNRTC